MNAGRSLQAQRCLCTNLQGHGHTLNRRRSLQTISPILFLRQLSPAHRTFFSTQYSSHVSFQSNITNTRHLALDRIARDGSFSLAASPICRFIHNKTNNKHPTKADSINQNNNQDAIIQIRLSKRMSELGICSRREAARILKDSNECDESNLKFLKEIIYLHGKPVVDGTGFKVPCDETNIQLLSGDDVANQLDSIENNEGVTEFKGVIPYAERPWNEIRGDTIVLNKPIGYVSGQEEHGHVPAVRLLTRSNLHLEEGDDETKETLSMGSFLHFSKKKRSDGGDKIESGKKDANDTSSGKSNVKIFSDDATLSGYAITGRLDIDSTGLLIFTKAGMVARRIIAPDSRIVKEYIVKVAPVIKISTREREMGITSLPPPTKNLYDLIRGGKWLWNDKKPLKPLKVAEWLEIDTSNIGEKNGESETLNGGTLRLVLQEGRKRQIRRMCRELLGMHVVSLKRVSVGPIKLDSLPEGKWRPLKEEEVHGIFEDRPMKKKRNRKRRQKNI